MIFWNNKKIIKEKILNNLSKIEGILLSDTKIFGKEKVLLFSLLLTIRKIIVNQPEIIDIIKEEDLENFLFKKKHTILESTLNHNNVRVDGAEFNVQQGKNLLSYNQTWNNVIFNDCNILNSAFINLKLENNLVINNTIFKNCFFYGINFNKFNIKGDTKFIDCDFRVCANIPNE